MIAGDGLQRKQQDTATPEPTERLTETAYWDTIWQAKNNVRADLAQKHRSYVSAFTDHLYRTRLPQDRRWRFLEVGCGTGRWLAYFHHHFGYSVTGCDYSETSCATARQTLESAGIPGTIVKGDLFALTGEYDVVYSSGLIEHFTDPRTVLGKFTSLLNPEHGILISTVPNLAGLSGLYHRVLKPETFTTHRVVTMEQLRQWYTELGLRNVEVGAFGSLIPRRFPRDILRRRHPRLYRVFWTCFLGPLTWLLNRLCLWAFRRFGFRLESQRFSPYLYAIGERSAG